MMPSPERIWVLCLQIKAGIDIARDAGVICECPKTVEIDGLAFHFSTDLEDWRRRHKRFSATPETSPVPAGEWTCANCRSVNRDDYHRISCPGCGQLRPTANRRV